MKFINAVPVLLIILVCFARVNASNELTSVGKQIAQKMKSKAIFERTGRMETKSILDRAGPNTTDYSSYTRYKNCLPTEEYGSVKEMVSIIHLCIDCLDGFCPSECTMEEQVQSMQVKLCLEGSCCMRLFGYLLLDLWTYEGASSVECGDTMSAPCERQVNSTVCGNSCAVRFGIDDYDEPVLAPCPVGEPTGLYAPNMSIPLYPPAKCVSPPDSTNTTDMYPYVDEDMDTSSNPSDYEYPEMSPPASSEYIQEEVGVSSRFPENAAVENTMRTSSGDEPKAVVLSGIVKTDEGAEMSTIDCDEIEPSPSFEYDIIEEMEASPIYEVMDE